MPFEDSRTSSGYPAPFCIALDQAGKLLQSTLFISKDFCPLNRAPGMSSSEMEPFLLEGSDFTSQGNRSFHIVYGYVEEAGGTRLRVAQSVQHAGRILHCAQMKAAALQ